MTIDTLKWSAQFSVISQQRSKLHGDKITLPQSALEALLAAAPVVALETNGDVRRASNFDPFNPYTYDAERHAREAFADRQQQLPHPLTFRLVNPENGRAVYAGIRDFSAEEGEVGLSNFLQEALGFKSGATPLQTSRDGTPVEDTAMIDGHLDKTLRVTVHAHQLAKGTYVRLRPLEAGYDAEDWKSLLERYLRDNFTTLTNGEILEVSGSRHEHFRFLVDKFEPPGDGVCIVDTDLEVDIEALNEEQARETLNRRLAKAKRAPGTSGGSSAGGTINLDVQVTGQVLPGQYVDYELRDWPKHTSLEARLEGNETGTLGIMINPFHAHQRAKPRIDEHMFSDLSCRPSKRVKLSSTNVDMEVAEKVYVSVSAHPVEPSDDNKPLQYTLQLSQATDISSSAAEESIQEPDDDEVRCKNCHQIIPKRTLPLHEAFCYRNNVACPTCQNVFLKNSEAWKEHWHCPHDDEYGSGAGSRARHDSIFHPPETLRCPACDYEAFNIPILAQHRMTDCPGKEILCQFCHLIVPQQGPDDPAFTDAEVLLSGMTPHEVTDGSRTTECHLCGKIVKLQIMKTHLQLHDRDRILKPTPKLCSNLLCGRTIKSGKEFQADREQLGLCDECFGPLHGTTYDPDGKALRRRVERRLLQQLMGGCGKPWCHNAEWCRTGRRNSTGNDVVVSMKDALPSVRPVLDHLAKGDHTGLVLCTDEVSQSRRAMGEMLSAEGVYDLGWTIKALEEARNDLVKARSWLKDMAPKKDEIVQ